jgi:hypothetical protein
MVLAIPLEIVGQGVKQDMEAVHPGALLEVLEKNTKVKQPEALLGVALYEPMFVFPLF